MRRTAVLLAGLAASLAAGCGGRSRDVADAPPPVAAQHDAPELASTPAPDPGADFDAAAWAGRCVIAQGYALEQKIGPLLDLGGPSLGVVFEDGGRWPVPIGTRVRVRGHVVARDDLPVFVPNPDEPVVQGIPVAPGTDLEQARRRYVIEDPEVTAVRTREQVVAELEAQLGGQVSLSGVLWSRNGVWWFAHEGVDLHLELAGEHDFEDHGKPVTLTGKLTRAKQPSLDQVGIREQPEPVESFVLRVSGRVPHPAWPLEPCPE